MTSFLPQRQAHTPDPLPIPCTPLLLQVWEDAATLRAALQEEMRAIASAKKAAARAAEPTVAATSSQSEGAPCSLDRGSPPPHASALGTRATHLFIHHVLL